ncbi:hypothetical protein OU415_02255 [Saccharopolyspora sp. WRP15-2]|uniref:Uncharacterized protein n=1 Tax=Saccharopolyspora oryzae TaxID=2997343 RepID=A0ABT4URA2_9PSEU|nr:hypothetical protein [Saccharopolyspora oryzae]MDA3624239.1 hypothetical protein [Saccharopolyspora oryzae]
MPAKRGKKPGPTRPWWDGRPGLLAVVAQAVLFAIKVAWDIVNRYHR